MKKSAYLSVLSLVFIVQQSYGQRTRTLFDNDILFGKIKQVSEIKYFPDHNPQLTIMDTILYDENGKTLEIHTQYKFGTLHINKFSITQGHHGKKMDVTSNQDNERVSSKFDSRGNMIEYDIFKNGILSTKTSRKYDKKDNMVKFVFSDKTNGLKLTRFYKYNEDKMVTEENDNGGKGRFDYQIMYHYENFDKNGNWIKRTSKKKLPSGETVDDQIIEREIIYYR
jgi:hypothetical protein